MFFFIVSFFPFLFLMITKPLLPSWLNEMRLVVVLLCQESCYHLFHFLKNHILLSSRIMKYSCSLFLNKNEADIVPVAATSMTILDLPELALDMILEKLSPSSMCNVANVCTSLRERCTSDYLWERHMREKWGKVIGKAAESKWEIFKNSRTRNFSPNWFSCLKKDRERISSFKNTIMAKYLALERGKFWFPAQVYNRENGHVGFMLSCYDAELSYDSQTDSFHARYPPHGQRLASVEEGVKWERIRSSPVDTPPHDLHVSDCLMDLRPGDHIEIQWRRNKEFPYGWWYGVVGHLDSCSGIESHCSCFSNDTVNLEFNHYTTESRWRRTTVNRKDHTEEGNEIDGFYGGIRKLYNKDEISMWRHLWPTEILE